MQDEQKPPAMDEAERCACMRAHYADLTNPELAEKMGCTVKEIIRLNYKLQLRKRPEVRNKLQTQGQRERSIWKGAFLEVFLLMFAVMKDDDLSDLLGVSRYAIIRKARILGLRKAKLPRPKKARQPRAERPPKAERAPAAPRRMATAKPERSTKPACPPVARRANTDAPKKLPAGPKLPPPMTPAMVERMERERFSYPDGLPFRARAMWGPSLNASDTAYRPTTSL